MFAPLLASHFTQGPQAEKLSQAFQPVNRFYKLLPFFSILFKVLNTYDESLYIFSLLYDYKREKILTENFILF